MGGYCLKNGKIREAWPEDATVRAPEFVFRLASDGEIEELAEIPVPAEGEGILTYSGEFYIEPLEIEIEFLKAANAEKWLEALVLRHADRVRHVSEDLFVTAEIKEVDA